MKRTLTLLLGLICAALLVVFFTRSETPMTPPKKPNETEQGTGTAPSGERVAPGSEDAPEQSDRKDQEAGIGMPMTPEELRRLKEEADKPDSEN